MKYWLYRDTRILGPFGREELERMDGVGPGTLVCPESALGQNDGDWRSLDETMGGPAQSPSPPSPAFPEGEEYSRDWVSSFYYRDASGPEPSLLDLPGPEEFAQSRVRVVELEDQLRQLMDRVGELEAEQGQLLRQLWKIGRGEVPEGAAPPAVPVPAPSRPAPEIPIPKVRREAPVPLPEVPAPPVEKPPAAEPAGPAPSSPLSIPAPPVKAPSPAEPPFRAPGEEIPAPAPEVVSQPPSESPTAPPSEGGFVEAAAPTAPPTEISPSPVEPTPVPAPAAAPEPGSGGVHLKLTRPKPRQLKFKPTKTLPRAEGSPVQAIPPAPLPPAPLDAASIEVRVPEAPPPVPLPPPVEAPSFPPMPVIQAPPPPPPPTQVPPPMAVAAPAPAPVLQAPSEPPVFPPMPPLGSSEPAPPPALSQPALPPLTMTFSAGPKAEVPAPMMAPVPQISPAPQPALTPGAANSLPAQAPPTGGADPGAMTGGADVVARLAKGRDKNETAPPQPKRRPSKALYVMALFGIVAVLFIAWVAKDRKALRTMMSMGKDQPAIGEEVPEEEPPVQKPSTTAPAPAAEAAPAPTAAPAAPEAEDPIPTAINLTKEYPLDGDRGSIGQWLQYSFSTGGKEEWTAGAVDSQTYLVQYKVVPEGGAAAGRAPISYLFETDIVKKTVKGRNPDAKQLLSGGGGAESAKPAAAKPAVAKPAKAAPKARRKPAAKPARPAAPAPEAAGPMIEDGELAPPAEEDAQP